MSEIKLGVVGVGRGTSLAHLAPAAGMRLVAVCDTWEEGLKEAGERLGAETYSDYDRFLEHDLDAIVLANYFHEHAPFAIKALESGRHVLSETTACKTLAEGVELIEAVERTGLIYMLAENYPYMVFNQEMRRLYTAGEVGELRYGEGEYVHPFDAAGFNAISRGLDHWRNWIPMSYYCTHALAPLMYITETEPVIVNGFCIPHDPGDPQQKLMTRRGDPAGSMVLRMDNGAVVKLLQGLLPGHGVWVRVHGNRGAMENARHGNGHAVRIWKEPWDRSGDEPGERVYVPSFPRLHEQATAAGHGGGDLFVTVEFAEAIRTSTQPFFDVYRAVQMSYAGILAHRSAIADGAPERIVDVRDPTARASVATDKWSPDPADAGPGQPFPSIRGDVRPSLEAVAFAKGIWGS